MDFLYPTVMLMMMIHGKLEANFGDNPAYPRSPMTSRNARISLRMDGGKNSGIYKNIIGNLNIIIYT
jgi:hypothetical protein